MSLRGWFRQVVGPRFSTRIPSRESQEHRSDARTSKSDDPNLDSENPGGEGLSAARIKDLEDMLAALEAGCLDPPRDVRDPDAWDEYWKNQMKFGAMERTLMDGMSSDLLFLAY